MLASAALVVCASPGAAQNRGQYILGSGGLNAGAQAPPGFTAGTFYVRYDASTARDARGDALPVEGSYVMHGGELLLAYTTVLRWAGATYGVSAVLFYLDGQPSLERFGVSSGGAGFGDVYIEPFSLGWHHTRFSSKFAYGVIAPVGEPSVTTDFWGHDLTAAITFFLDPSRRTQISANSVTEIHQKKRSTDLTVGDNTNLELAIGHALRLPGSATPLLQIGVAAYGQWQLDDDTGLQAQAAPHLAAQKDRVFGIGPELGLLLPDFQTSLVARAEREFGARSRAEGWVLFTGVAKSF